ncbi:hypothetical protein RF55_13572 [Lasius niger]|uniref:CCHC-type domain-containing protein n=1 Tax=Lasius niger TaxID=67767 RepID=A0A0J7KAB3_LASNI|nr:hypothetical protein RF55_13572 [Lasius niger]
MHQITSVFSETEKKSLPPPKVQKAKDVVCNSCGKTGHIQENCRKGEVSCVYCKAPGHQRNSCPKLKAKEQASTFAQATSHTVAAVSKDPEESTQVQHTVAFVQPDNDIPGHNESARPYNSILSPDKLKPWVKHVLND